MTMKQRKRKCLWCADPFFPNARLKSRQMTCGKNDCLLKQRRAAKKSWRWKHRALQRQMVRDWFAAHPDYLKTYRGQHPGYQERNRRATRLRMWQCRFDKRNRYFSNRRKIREKQISASV